MDHAQVLGLFRPALVVEQSSAQSACPAVLIVRAGLAAGQIVQCVVLVVVVVAVFARMRLLRPRAFVLGFRPPVPMCMHSVVVAVVLYQWSWLVVQWLEYVGSSQEYWISLRTSRMILWSRLLVVVGSSLPVLLSVAVVVVSSQLAVPVAVAASHSVESGR